MQERKKVALKQSPLSRYLPTQVRTGMMQKQRTQEMAPKSKRPSFYMRTASTKRFVMPRGPYPQMVSAKYIYFFTVNIGRMSHRNWREIK